ncbi:MAG TPA: LPS export ABC transporter periplasmic protein LptC [Methylomirabilota bacterium]|jgi:LPS export ABC transporter protein LptC|nr:LPS export ABC transporter periplasmic protein LptC [Methylomirabilota bacterium]
MRRLSTVFLVCFVALLAGLGGMVAWKARARRAPAPAPPAQQADYRIQEVHVNETLEGNLRFTLDADRAEVFDKDQRTVMHKVVVRLFSKDGEWTLTADEGVLDNAKRDVSLSGNVVVASNDGLRMTTQGISWRNDERHLYTDEAVEIKRAGTTITGRGLDLRMREQEAVLEKNVRVVIQNRANANLALFPRSGL